MNSSSRSSARDITLITGASSGIGHELAREFARHGHTLALVSTDPVEIGAVSARISDEFGVEVVPIPQDLIAPGAVDTIADELERQGFVVENLVNNAGVGQRGRFWDVPLERHLEVIAVDVQAPVALTHHLLPGMVRRGRGRILNTASIAGFEPGPTLAVYHAAKAFVLSWSEALATELEGSGLTVTTLCPGPVDTEFFPKADMEDTKVFQKGNVMAPQDVAITAYAGLMGGDRLVVPGGMNKVMAFARRFLPLSAQAKQNEKYYEEADSADRKREPGEIEERAEAKRR